jgi:MFS family permease
MSSMGKQMLLRGGFTVPSVTGMIHTAQTPTTLFNGLFVALSALTVGIKGAEWVQRRIAAAFKGGAAVVDDKPKSVKDLQKKFLAVFWLVRMADWLQGPYFYEVYASKVLNGVPASMDTISKLFLVGFATTGLLGPLVGRQVDLCGRRAGTVAFTVLYALGALSTRTNMLWLLLLGRVAGGIGTSLLFSAPEAWMVAEHQNKGHAGKWIGETFGLAYGGDAIVAIVAGQLASMAATRLGPTGPYTLSLGFLAASALGAMALWTENKAPLNSGGTDEVSIGEALNEIKKDKRIMLLGATQALFEGAMYIFVIQWVPALRSIIEQYSFGVAGSGATIPFGKVFSCFMACCLLGTTVFSRAQKMGLAVETLALLMLALATCAMTMATTVGMGGSLGSLIAALFVFEACVGMYFPSIGILRSKIIPDTQRSVIMNLFGLPLNLIVVGVFLSLKHLGIKGAFGVSSAALALATLCMAALRGTKPKLKAKTEERCAQ